MFKLSIISLSILAAFSLASTAQADESKTSRISQKSIASTQVISTDRTVAATDKNASEQKRESLYTNRLSGENLKAEYRKIHGDAKTLMVNGKQVLSKKRSKPSIEKSTGHLYLYDAAVLLEHDHDGDGFYSKIRVDFDANANYAAYYDVYAELYIRELGTSTWTHYYTTDVFTIYGANSSDVYNVSTEFNEGFPPAYYEIAIDLFRYGYSGVESTLHAVNDPDLTNLPIEDITHDVLAPHTNVAVSTVKTELFHDNDNDGYYHDFKITFDADVAGGGQRSIVAKLYQKSGAGDWLFEAQSDVYTLTGTNTDDAISFEAVWESGYATAQYDFKIEILDSATNELLTVASNDFGALVAVPLEDKAKDRVPSSGSSVSPAPSTSSSGSGGGSWSWFGLLVLSAVAWSRNLKAK